MTAGDEAGPGRSHGDSGPGKDAGKNAGRNVAEPAGRNVAEPGQERGQAGQERGQPAGRNAAEPAVTVIVDGANVVGSRPDGWWRDRAGAAVRLHDELAKLAVRGAAGHRGRASGHGRR